MWLEPFLGSSSPPTLVTQTLLLFLTSVWKCALCVPNKSTWLIMPFQFDSWLGWQVKLPVWISGTEWEETELVWSWGDGRGEESVLVGRVEQPTAAFYLFWFMPPLMCKKNKKNNKWSILINAVSLSLSPYILLVKLQSMYSYQPSFPRYCFLKSLLCKSTFMTSYVLPCENEREKKQHIATETFSDFWYGNEDWLYCTEMQMKNLWNRWKTDLSNLDWVIKNI